MKQTEIAEMLKVSDATISALKNGVHVSWPIAQRLQELFGGSLEQWKNAEYKQIMMAFEIFKK